MKQNGWFIAKKLKTINLYLWSTDITVLEDSLKYDCPKGCKIVPYYVTEDKGFIKYDGVMYRIK